MAVGMEGTVGTGDCGDGGTVGVGDPEMEKRR